jgi:hypothetical protein
MLRGLMRPWLNAMMACRVTSVCVSDRPGERGHHSQIDSFAERLPLEASALPMMHTIHRNLLVMMLLLELFPGSSHSALG